VLEHDWSADACDLQQQSYAETYFIHGFSNLLFILERHLLSLACIPEKQRATCYFNSIIKVASVITFVCQSPWISSDKPGYPVSDISDGRGQPFGTALYSMLAFPRRGSDRLAREC
jgi:hypothetical protein